MEWSKHMTSHSDLLRLDVMKANLYDVIWRYVRCVKPVTSAINNNNNKQQQQQQFQQKHGCGWFAVLSA